MLAARVETAANVGTRRINITSLVESEERARMLERERKQLKPPGFGLQIGIKFLAFVTDSWLSFGVRFRYKDRKRPATGAAQIAIVGSHE